MDKGIKNTGDGRGSHKATRGGIVSDIAFHLWTLQPSSPKCALGELELKVKLRGSTLSLQSTSTNSNPKCRLVFHVGKDKIKVKIRKGAFAAVPVLTACAVTELNKLIAQLDLKGSVFDFFKIFTKAALEREVGRVGEYSEDDAGSQFVIETRDLFRLVLNHFDLNIYSSNLKLKVKKRNASKLGRKTVDIRDQQGMLRVVKEPHATEAQQELQSALREVKDWIRPKRLFSDFTLIKKVIFLAESLRSAEDCAGSDAQHSA